MSASIRPVKFASGGNTDNVCGAKPEQFLPAELFANVVAHAPLVAIDLIVTDAQGAVLLGLRNNPPAQGYWFVPGGRIRKNETIDTAFMRIAEDELGYAMHIGRSRLMGVFEHFYDVNFAGVTGASTHYIVFAYQLQTEYPLLALSRQQHSQTVWMQPDQAKQHPLVHPYTHAYFELATK
ncbi:MAG: GDP-mannose mannosyl hydrolase [Glaciimonas sp.]|nr:GDP-mannose mannosyl hydrolase [Glaciimonas sp.]